MIKSVSIISTMASSGLTREKVSKWGDTMKNTSNSPANPMLTKKDTDPRSVWANIKYLGAPPPRTGSVAQQTAEQQKIVDEIMRTPTGSQEHPDEEFSKMAIRDLYTAGRKKRKTKKRKTKKRKTRKHRK